MRIKPLYTLLLLFISLPIHAELLLTAPPLAPKTAIESAIAPLLADLEASIGEKVTLEYPKNWLEYSRDIRSDRYDLAISEAHVLSLSLLDQNSGGLSHSPLVTYNEWQDETVLVSFDTKVTSPLRLVNKKICVKPSPSLDSVRLYSLYSNPVSQPLIVEVSGSYERLLQDMKKGKCHAAVIVAKEGQTQDDLNIVHAFDQTPPPGVTMSVRLTPEVKTALETFFYASENQENILNVLNVLADRSEPSNLRPFKTDEYTNLYQMLSSVWGW